MQYIVVKLEHRRLSHTENIIVFVWTKYEYQKLFKDIWRYYLRNEGSEIFQDIPYSFKLIV